ncbi:MAG: ABC transporter permease [Eubacterium sp.]|nr:ABC transporter permease [Eubacterium sp.]
MSEKISNRKKNTMYIPFLGDIAVSTGRTLLGIALGLLASAILIMISGVNPLAAYASLLNGAFGSPQAFSNVLVRASPLLLGGIAVSIGVKTGVWNTGIEGYMYIGAIGATLVGVHNLGLPPVLHILLCVLAAVILAGLWGAIPGYLRAYKGVNEVTSTIMLNYVAIYLTNWLVSDVTGLADKGAFYPMSLPLADSACLPILMKGTSLHPGPFLGIAVCLVFFFVINYTAFGYRTRMIGSNPFAAKYAGANSRRQIMTMIVLGAMIGGLSGAIETMGLKYRLYMDFVTGVGYESVAVALLAGGNPISVILAAFFFAALKAGGATMSIETGVASSMNSIIIAMCMLFVIGVGIVDSRRTRKVVSTDKTSSSTSKETEEA